MACMVALRYPVVAPAVSPAMSPPPRSARTFSWPSPVTGHRSPVTGHRKDLHPAIQQDEHRRGRVSLDTQGRTRRILLALAQGHQVALLITCKQLPESVGRSHPLHVRVTIGLSDMAASR